MSKKAGITKGRLKADLEKIGLIKGDHVAVALSFKSIGFVEDGPDAFIDSILEVLGAEGTLMMNAFTISFPLGEVRRDYVFDSMVTVPYTGLVPRTLMKSKEARRSRHPTCSVAAAGRLARYLTEGHDENSVPYLPYEKLARVGGKLLCIGLDDRLVALRHEAQRKAGLFVVPMYHGVQFKNRDGRVCLYVWRLPPCMKRLPELVPELESAGIIKRGMIGEALSVVGSVDELLEAMSSMLKKDPTLNLCYDFSCLSCRELERRMDLYERIRNLRFFQKSLFVRRLLNCRNRLLLRRYSCVSFYSSGWKRKIRPAFVVEVSIRRLVWFISKFLE